MSHASVSLATLAPPPPPPHAVAPPQLPDLPLHLQNGGPGVARLPAATGKVAAIPRLYLLAVAIPLAVTVMLTLAVPITPWPTPVSLVKPVTPAYPQPRQVPPTGRRRRPPAQRRGTPRNPAETPGSTTPTPPAAPTVPSPSKVDQLRPD